MLRSIRAFGVSLWRAIVDLAESLWYEGTSFALALVLSFLSPATWVVISLFDATLVIAILLVMLLLVNIRLLRAQRALAKRPWSFRWSLRRCITECLAGCLATGLGVEGHTTLGRVFGIVPLVSVHYSDVALLTGAFVILVIFGVPGCRFWWITRRFHLLRVTEKILVRLDARYAEHLSHLLPAPDISFPVDASLTLSEAQQTVPASPTQLTQPEPLAFPALSDLLPQPSPETSVTPAAVTHAQICGFFDESHRQMVIQSGSGGGKSTQLYLLAHTLLVEANATLNQLLQEAASGIRHTKLSKMPPLPIIMDLSVLDIGLSAASEEHIRSWQLRDWQREALVKVYGVRRRTARRWVAKGLITSLFDSLDVPNDQALYFGCIDTYLSEHENTSIVVCCSEEQYQSYLNYLNSHRSWRADDSQPDSLYGSRLPLPVVTLESLSPETVEQALRNAGNADAIRHEMQHDATLAKTLRSPMMLSLALAGASYAESGALSDATSSAVGWPMKICRQYVSGMLSAYSGNRSWSPKQAEETMAWLGYRLKERQKRVFHLEEMQFSWLPSPLSEAVYDRQIIRLRVVFTIAATLLFGIAISHTVSLVYSLSDGTVIIGGAPGTTAAVGSASTVGDISRIIFGILGGFGVALGVGHKITMTKRIRLLKHIQPNADAHWRKVTIVALLGICALLTAAFIGGPVIVPSGVLLIGLSASMALGLLIAWCGRLATERNHFPRPNRGLYNAIRSSLVIIVILAFIGLVIGSVIAMAALSLLVGIGANLDLRFIAAMLVVCAGVFALTAAIFAGLSMGFSNGGGSVLRHFILRRALRKSRIVPRKFVPFLESLRGIGLLRREGDGYALVLRSAILRDYFAADYVMHYLTDQQLRVGRQPLHKRLAKPMLRASQAFAPRRISQAIQPRH